MSNKVVINACYGGFSLSREAVLLGRKISGDVTWCPESIQGDTYGDGQVIDEDYGGIDDMPRHDETLVQVVEELGSRANGLFAGLEVRVIDGAIYRIDEYDGYESVEVPESIDWVTIK